MRTTLLSRWSALALLLLCTACATTSPQYYTLKTPLSLQPAASSKEPAYQGFVIKQVDIPLQLDRRQIVLSRDGGAQVQLLNDFQWVSPLGDELQLALQSGLQARLAKPELATVLAGDKYWLLSVAVSGFDSVLGRHVAQEFSWNLQARGFEAPTYQCRFVQQAQTSADLEALVLAHQQLLGNMMDILTAQMNSQSYAGADGVLLSCAG